MQNERVKKVLVKAVTLVLILTFVFNGTLYAAEGTLYYPDSEVSDNSGGYYAGGKGLLIKQISVSRDVIGGTGAIGELFIEINNKTRLAEFMLSGSKASSATYYVRMTLNIRDKSTGNIVKSGNIEAANLSQTAPRGYLEFTYEYGKTYDFELVNFRIETSSGSKVYTTYTGTHTFTMPRNINNDKIEIFDISSQKFIFKVTMDKDLKGSTGTKEVKRTRLSDGNVTNLTFDNMVISSTTSGNSVIYTLQDSGLDPDTLYKYDFTRWYETAEGIKTKRINTFQERTGPPPMDIAAEEAELARKYLDGSANGGKSLAAAYDKANTAATKAQTAIDQTTYNSKSAAQWASEAAVKTGEIKTDIGNMSSSLANRMDAIELKLDTDLTEVKNTLINIQDMDDIPPTIGSMKWQSNKTITPNSSETLIVDVNDNRTVRENLTYQYKVNNGDYSVPNIYSESITINIDTQPGLKNINIRFIDEAGNISVGFVSIWKL